MRNTLIVCLVIIIVAGASLFYCGGFRCLQSEPQKTTPTPTRPTQVPFPSEEHRIDIDAPILLVPGILGSWTKDPDMIHEKVDIRDLRDWVITEDRVGLIIGDVFGHLKARLGVKGYKLGKDVFNAPYDWRQSINNHRAIMDWIDSAKAEFKIGRNKTVDQVDVVAHSLGGLVVRSYIQSDSYRGDIRYFAVIASPNFGAADSYYTWSGGIVPPTSSLGFSLFLKSTLNAMNKKIAPKPGRPLVPFIRDFIHSMQDLLPVGHDATTSGYLSGWPGSGVTAFGNMAQVNQNRVLTSLNDTLPLLSQRTKAQFFLATGEKTMRQIQVARPRGSYGWEDGEPTGSYEAGDGDGRVPLSTSVLSKSFPVVTTPAEHQQAVCAFTPDIFKFLGIPFDKGDQCWSSSRRGNSALALSITTTSKAELSFTNPSGQQYSYERADTPKWSSSRFLFLLLREPPQGLYQLTLTGPPGIHHIFADYLEEPATTSSLQRTFEFKESAKGQLTFELNKSVLQEK